MAEFLESLESNLPYAVRASSRLRDHVKDLDGLIDAAGDSALRHEIMVPPFAGAPTSFVEASMQPNSSASLPRQSHEILMEFADGLPWVDEGLDSIPWWNYDWTSMTSNSVEQ
jgi:hypothetical protein